MKYNSIAVTGAAGFIGSVFVDMVMKRNPNLKVAVIDKLTYAGNFDNLSKEVRQSENFRFFCADICDIESMRKILDEVRPEAIINFAAESHVDNSIKNPFKFTETNVIGTQTLLEVCKEQDIERFHQVSTDEVYGELPLEKPDLKFVETMPLKTSSPYSASKAAADMFALAYGKTFGIDVTISRCSNNFGRNQHDEKFIPTIIRHAIKDEQVPIYGCGCNVRDWIYVEDHCDAIDFILDNGVPGEIYNVGGHAELDNITLAKKILNLMGKPLSLMTFVNDRLGHDLRYAIDDSKLEKLGWGGHQNDNFEDNLSKTVKWYETKYQGS